MKQFFINAIEKINKFNNSRIGLLLSIFFDFVIFMFAPFYTVLIFLAVILKAEGVTPLFYIVGLLTFITSIYYFARNNKEVNLYLDLYGKNNGKKESK